jgi:hypothetical protein
LSNYFGVKNVDVGSGVEDDLEGPLAVNGNFDDALIGESDRGLAGRTKMEVARCILAEDLNWNK